MEYRGADGGESERELDPYGLAYRAGRWYVVGHCHLRGGLRSFRLDRVGTVRALDTYFERPEGFDVAAHLTLSVATLPRAYAVEVLLRTDLAEARRVVFPAFGVLEAAEGGVLLRGQTEDLRWFALELSRLPFPFDVVGPVGLRDAVVAHARALLRRAAEGTA
jgi:predicted DNA-binding transcriptional regulator YafY